MSEKRIRVAINGFGRIGIAALRAIVQEHYEVEVVAINTSGSTPIEGIAYSLKYDSVYGRFPQSVETLDPKKGSEMGRLKVGEWIIPILGEKDANHIPWASYGVDVVLECTGAYLDKKAMGHIKSGAGKVILSAPPKDNSIPVYILGVNEDKYDGEEIISNGSCTTNCVAPLVKLIDETIGFEKGVLTTIHAYTTNQSLVDSSASDPRRARAAAINIVPTSTGAAEAVIACYPEAAGRFAGSAIRVPVVCGSYSDLTFKLVKKTTPEEINAILENAASSKNLVGRLKIAYEPLVSSDVIGNSASCLVDVRMTKVVDEDMVQIGAWYDNEYGYACRLVEMGMWVCK